MTELQGWVQAWFGVCLQERNWGVAVEMKDTLLTRGGSMGVGNQRQAGTHGSVDMKFIEEWNEYYYKQLGSNTNYLL